MLSTPTQPLNVTPTAQAAPVSASNSIFNEVLANPALASRRMSVAPGTVLYEPDAPAQNLYFIHRGQVRTYVIGSDDYGRLIDILGQDAWFGEASLARHTTYGEQAVAVVPTVLTEVPAERFLANLVHNPRAATELYKQLAQKLTAAREDAAGLVFDDCHSRLVKALVRFSRSAAAAPHGDGVVLRITHEQLAQAIGVARETVSLALTQLRQRNLLRTGRNQLMFNPEVLRGFCGPARKLNQAG
jgi:CRP/FNR family cyclic AMP-dependent transcriptional regulator